MKQLTILLLLLNCSCVYGQERYVTIDRQKFRIKEFGKGDVTVIFESGMSDSLEAWGSLPDSISDYARVFLYDRADIGKSDTSIQERTIPNMVNELQSILKAEQINHPYVFVGHSLGGLIGRYFSSQYPDQVKGLLLLDPAPEAFWENMSKRKLNKYLKGGNEWYRTKHKPIYRKEWYQLIPNLAYMKDLNIPPDLPVILVTASQSQWYQYHEAIISGLHNAYHVELEGGHYIHRDHPGLIIEYIKDLIIY